MTGEKAQDDRETKGLRMTGEKMAGEK